MDRPCASWLLAELAVDRVPRLWRLGPWMLVRAQPSWRVGQSARVEGWQSSGAVALKVFSFSNEPPMDTSRN
jgi:hypothetical protein